MYFKELKRHNEVIKECSILTFEQSGKSFRFKMVVDFKNGSCLYVKEVIIDGRIKKYSYHWQDESGKLLCRWDNAPDWDVPTFPHHKHTANEVLPSLTITFTDVLNEIVEIIKGEATLYK